MKKQKDPPYSLEWKEFAFFQSQVEIQHVKNSLFQKKEEKKLEKVLDTKSGLGSNLWNSYVDLICESLQASQNK